MSYLKANLNRMSDSNMNSSSYQVVRVATGPQYSVGIAYIWFCFTFVGLAGFQHFYLGRNFRGVLWLFTWGLLGIGSVYDLFALAADTHSRNLQNSQVVVVPSS
jgi:TM2 domain-containing membrane protein YozV